MIINLEDLDKIKERGLRSLSPDKIKVSVGMATCGLATGAQEVYDEIGSVIETDKETIELAKTGCLGFCQMEPVVGVTVPGMPCHIYKQMTPEKVRGMIVSVKESKINKDDVLSGEDPFFAKQKKIALRNCGFIDPDSIEEYVARGGYYSLYKTLSDLSSADVIEEIKTSGIRGRGGAGFPTGLKWEYTSKAEGDIKYVVCNADEGDPGAYMDRSILEGDPHSVLEGMIIGAYAIGATQGFIYARTEYPLAVRRLTEAIRQAKELGILGDNIFNSGFSFKIEIREGSGAFVCGEETSLIHSIEGTFPEPRQRPPFPAQSGLWGDPTNINNVETWANVPVIIGESGGWFAKIGTDKSKGTKVFSVVGKVKNTGLVEVPMGITLREIIYDIGGGIPDGKKLKAIQTGGPSGGCIPGELIDLAVDYESLQEAGSIMGSGGMVVMDEDTCVVDVSKFFLAFTNDESCGKCTSCRDGGEALFEILTRISEGDGKESDLEFLEELAEGIKNGSMCALGQTLPNPVLSTLRYFRDEYEAHIKEKRCPAGVCKALTAYYVDPEKCKACGICAKNCSVNAISGKKGVAYVVDPDKCTKCGVCFDVCPKKFSAVKKVQSSKLGIKS